MDTTKILVSVRIETLQKFKAVMQDLPLKRDAYLDQAIQAEIPEFKKEMADRRMSDKAFRYVRRSFKRDINSTRVSIELRKSTAHALDAALKATNTPRDSFINRLLLFMNCTEGLLKFLDIAADDSVQYGVPVSPMLAARCVLRSPLSALRESLQKDPSGSDGIYITPLPRKLVGIACYLSDWEVPGTDEYEAFFDDIKLDLEDHNVFLDQVRTSRGSTQPM
jgi:hypothetical protein